MFRFYFHNVVDVVLSFQGLRFYSFGMQYVLKMFDFDPDVDIDAVHINDVVDNEVKIIRCEVQIHR